MDIILVRHGQTQDNVKGIFSTKETILTDEGKEQIRRTKTFVDTLSFDKVYVSPLYRAIQTMEILGLDGKREERIKEVDFGLFEGNTYEQIKDKFPEEAKIWDEDYINFVTPRGESIKMAYERVTSFLEEILNKGEDALLVCHAGVIRIALSWVFDNLDYYFKFRVENGSVNVISIDESGFKYIEKANYTVK
ncbi:histidine phosphatase family protein [Tepidimicrobium xylanilyticum]|uniref:Alpha-ribazole phosphatase n=1 Tax=Tepidimicrobium xylanilyticum TaxID=1123352 RepID=A0A1H2TKT9_9FIRM|nr:histidine phosphatase family protein [Tepidimicrobium xylanilyticum]GMG95915.1 phosphoglycerate mutase [Tepidimicrobium xylanilyticum]SDW44626.1 alpha-ribazole phosphatase [Tepidimicrobium xylanilyticum]